MFQEHGFLITYFDNFTSSLHDISSDLLCFAKDLFFVDSPVVDPFQLMAVARWGVFLKAHYHAVMIFCHILDSVTSLHISTVMMCDSMSLKKSISWDQYLYNDHDCDIVSLWMPTSFVYVPSRGCLTPWKPLQTTGSTHLIHHLCSSYCRICTRSKAQTYGWNVHALKTNDVWPEAEDVTRFPSKLLMLQWYLHQVDGCRSQTWVLCPMSFQVWKWLWDM